MRADIGSQCLECYRAGRPAAATRVKYWSAGQQTIATYAMMAISIAVFLWAGLGDPDNMAGRRITPQAEDLALTEAAISRYEFRVFGTATGEWYRVVTSGFYHYGILHLAFNMFMLYQLGRLLEPLVGRIRFVLLYVAALLGGSAGVLLLTPNALTAGASGAVFGLLGAAAIAQYQRGINPLSTSLGTVLMLNLLITFWLPNISIGGHVGGLLAGAAAGWFTTAPKQRAMPAAVTYAAPVVVAAAAAAICYAAGRL